MNFDPQFTKVNNNLLDKNYYLDLDNFWIFPDHVTWINAPLKQEVSLKLTFSIG